MGTQENETQLAKTAVDEILSNITICELMLGEEKESKENVAFGAQVKGLKGLFDNVKELVDASLLKKPGKVKGIREFLNKNAPEHTEESGTEYLGSLFKFPVNSAQSYNLAKSLKAILDLLQKHSEGFFVKLITTVSNTANARIGMLLKQIPTLEKGISAYEKYQASQSSNISTASSMYQGVSSSTRATADARVQPGQGHAATKSRVTK